MRLLTSVLHRRNMNLQRNKMLGQRKSRTRRTVHSGAARLRSRICLETGWQGGARRSVVLNNTRGNTVRPYQQRTQLRSGHLLTRSKHSRREPTMSHTVQQMRRMLALVAKNRWRAKALLPQYRSPAWAGEIHSPVLRIPGVTRSQTRSHLHLPCLLLAGPV